MYLSALHLSRTTHTHTELQKFGSNILSLVRFVLKIFRSIHLMLAFVMNANAMYVYRVIVQYSIFPIRYVCVCVLGVDR